MNQDDITIFLPSLTKDLQQSMCPEQVIHST